MRKIKSPLVTRCVTNCPSEPGLLRFSNPSNYVPAFVKTLSRFPAAWCRDSCDNKRDGDYQCNCKGCPNYISCSRGRRRYRQCRDHRHCWNILKRRCGPVMWRNTDYSRQPKDFLPRVICGQMEV